MDIGYFTITITLNSGWPFKDFNENVKIQENPTAPNGNSRLGHFAPYRITTGSPFSIVVPIYNFYGMHVDVQQLEACPLE